jgi:hypothetical protein
MTHAVLYHVYKGSVCEPANLSCTLSLTCESYLPLYLSSVWLYQPHPIPSETLNHYLEPTETFECMSHILRSYKILTVHIYQIMHAPPIAILLCMTMWGNGHMMEGRGVSMALH